VPSHVQAFAVVGLGFGDEGKGSLVDFLTRLHGAKLVVRFNGGCQAAHNVVEPSGLHHCFSQFGSGTLAGAATHLAPGMLVEPFALLREADILRTKTGSDPLEGLTIDPDCVITTPYHEQANQIEESFRGAARHGSCGRGIGKTRADELDGLALHAKDLGTPATREILRAIKDRHDLPRRDAEVAEEMADHYAEIRQELQFASFEDALRLTPGPVIFEGAQGFWLDEKYGFAPHNSWTDCTFGNAEKILNGAPMTKIGVLRAYATRHGAGPFPSEDASLNFPELHNGHGQWQGCFRLGHLDEKLARSAMVGVGGIDELAINHLDCFSSGEFTWRNRYGKIQVATKHPIEALEQDVLHRRIKYASFGPTFEDKRVLY